MTDLALYRAVEAYTGSILTLFRDEEDGLLRAEVRLKAEVSTVYRATINGTDSPKIELLSNTVLRVAIPAAFESLPLSQLRVVCYADASLSQTEKTALPATIGFGLRVTMHNAEMQALQRAVRSLMMSMGSDIWEPNRGGGLRQLKGLLIDPSNTARLVQLVQIAVDRYNSNASTRRSTKKRASQYQVTRMEVLSVRAMTAAQAEYEYLTKAPSEEVELINSISADPNEVVIAASIMHDLRGPTGSITRVSSAVAV
jgi:hypothetical protein